MATLTVQNMTLAGLTATMASAGGSGDVFTNDGRTYLKVANGSGSSINVTITAQDTSEDVPGFGTVTISDTVVAVANGATKEIGFFPPKRFNNGSGQVAVSYSATSSVTVAAIRCPRQDKTA